MRPSTQSLQKTGGYKLHRQRPGARVTYWPDPRGPGHGVMWNGWVVDHLGDTVSLVWDHDDEFYETWSSGECRYKVDRGQMRFIPPPKERRVRIPDDQIFCKVCGKPRQLKCNCPRPGALKPEHWGQKVVPQLLTPSHPHDMMDISIGGNAPDEGKGQMMARKKAVEVLDEVEELEEVELEELDEPTEEGTAAEGSGDMLTAKAAASKIGTDARTLRKFLRKKHGTVGQGQRWEVDINDVDALKAEFLAWAKGTKEAKADKPKVTKPKPDAEEPAADAELEEFEEIEDLDFGDE